MRHQFKLDAFGLCSLLRFPTKELIGLDEFYDQAAELFRRVAYLWSGLCLNPQLQISVTCFMNFSVYLSKNFYSYVFKNTLSNAVYI